MKTMPYKLRCLFWVVFSTGFSGFFGTLIAYAFRFLHACRWVLALLLVRLVIYQTWCQGALALSLNWCQGASALPSLCIPCSA